MNRDHELRRHGVWSPGFSRLRSLRRTGPAKAGTPNKFMGSLHVQRCTRIGAMNHERKTTNIEHRTSNSEKVPLPPETLRAFEVRGSRFEVLGSRFMESLHVQRCTRIGAMNHERKTSNIEHRTSNSEQVPLPRETPRACEVR